MKIELPQNIELKKTYWLLETDRYDYHWYHHLVGAYHWSEYHA